MRQIAAFDIGSTNFRYVLGTPEGEFLTEPVTEGTDGVRLAQQIKTGVRTLQDRADAPIDAVSVSTTGLVDIETQVIEHFDVSPTRERRDIPLGDELRDAFDVDVHLENDCTAAVLADVYYGQGREHSCVVHVNFGSGIGAGVFENGRLFRGESGHAAEVGMFPVETVGELSSSGVKDAWEAYCSGGGIEQFVALRLRGEPRETVLRPFDEKSAADLFDAARAGDAVARDYVKQLAEYNAVGMSTVINAFNPGIVVVGGSVALKNPELTVERFRERVASRLLVAEPEIVLSDLGGMTGLYGSLAQDAYALEK